MRNFGWLILLPWATAGCSGGVELSGDGTDGGDVPAEA